MNTFEQEKTDLKNADGEIKTLRLALYAGALDVDEFTFRMRHAGAFEAEIVEAITLAEITF